ncbi:MAG: carboxypeptidase-like regulatory domain-containing protein [Gemmatimonadaceae bacterium]|nr:carboxypeptidase-like regulatory domain-containing protein [Gemmatimonadaceae bacterium]
MHADKAIGRPLVRCALVVLGGLTSTLHLPAQESSASRDSMSRVRAEVLRGRITNDSARALVGALVRVTRGPDRFTRETRSDSAGRWTLTFDAGTGDYLVSVSATGWRTVRRRVQRQSDEGTLVADFELGADFAQLAEMRVIAPRPVRASNQVIPVFPEPGASERWAEDATARLLPPTAVGDLALLATTVPGLTVTSAGVAALGADPGSSLTTLNGLALGTTTLPRAARLDVRVSTTTFDPTRGGFAGANMDIRLGRGGGTSGSGRTLFLTLDPAALQATDALGRAAGAPRGTLRASLGQRGELLPHVVGYSAALDLTRSTGDAPSLSSVDPQLLRAAGVSPDSVAQLDVLTRAIGVPLAADGAPVTRQRNALTWLARVDDLRDSLDVRALTTYASLSRESAFALLPITAASTAGRRDDRTVGSQLLVQHYFGPGRRILNESRLGASGSWTTVRPTLALPGATVFVGATDDGGASVGGVTELAFGGGAALPRERRTWTLEAANEMFANAGGTRHRVKALAWARTDGLRDAATPDALGTFAFPTLADVAAGTPVLFKRTLRQPSRDAATWNGALALAHRWTPTRRVEVLYGARLEGSGALEAAARNPALESALGVRSGVAPTRLRLSPRVGFTWTYDRASDGRTIGVPKDFGGFYRVATGTLRGGIGEFRDLVRPDLLAIARAATGLAGSTERLECVGAATPAPDWRAFALDPSNIPTACADGSNSILGERTPAVMLLSPDWDVPRSWRASLEWSTGIGAWVARLSGLVSLDLSLPGIIDANFAGIERGVLGEEGGRPLFIPSAAIDVGSGAVSAAAARRTASYGRVDVLTSDLRGRSAQLTLSLAPDFLRDAVLPRPFYASGSWTLQWTRRQFRGFDGAGFGDPQATEWAPGPGDARHVVLAQAGIRTRRMGTMSLFTRAQSGLPFTPIVDGDVDGDGRGGDRAFVPDPARASDPVIASQLRALLDDGAPLARRCVQRWAGRVPGRNSCRGPWTVTLNAVWRTPALRLPGILGQRLQPALYAENVLGGLDRLVNGNALRGWGQPTALDPVLLVRRGFDATPGRERFRYAINSRFGDARAATVLARLPFRLTLDVSLDLGTASDEQRLRRALRPPRPRGGPPARAPALPTAETLANAYLQNTSNLFAEVLAASDSLLLTPPQLTALRRGDSVFTARVLALYRPLGTFLAGLPSGASERPADRRAALDSIATIEREYWPLFWTQPSEVVAILTPVQQRLLPWLAPLVDVPSARRGEARWFSGYAVQMLRERRPPGGS